MRYHFTTLSNIYTLDIIHTAFKHTQLITYVGDTTIANAHIQLYLGYTVTIFGIQFNLPNQRHYDWHNYIYIYIPKYIIIFISLNLLTTNLMTIQKSKHLKVYICPKISPRSSGATIRKHYSQLSCSNKTNTRTCPHYKCTYSIFIKHYKTRNNTKYITTNCNWLHTWSRTLNICNLLNNNTTTTLTLETN